MLEIARAVDHKIGYVEVCMEDSPYENPIRDWDHIPEVMLAPKYRGLATLDDDPRDYSIREISKRYARDGGLALPVFAYHHSGVSFSISGGYPYNDPWDAGIAGIAYVSPEKARAEWGETLTPQELREKCRDSIESMVSLMNAVAANECYYVTWYDTECNVVDSCGGFWKTDNYTYEEMFRDMAEYAPEEYQHLFKRLEMGVLDPIKVAKKLIA